MDAAFGQTAEGVDAGLYGGKILLQGEIPVGAEGCRVHRRNEDGLGFGRRIGHGSERALLEAGPEAGLEQEVCHPFLVERGSLGHVKLDRVILSVGFHAHFEKFALVTADDRVNRTADRRTEHHFRAFLVGKKRRSRLDGVTLLDQEAGHHAAEISRFDSHQTRSDPTGHLAKGRSRNGKVQALFQSDLI